MADDASVEESSPQEMMMEEAGDFLDHDPSKQEKMEVSFGT
jgi:hypothetical protein